MTIFLIVTANIIRSIYCQNKYDKNVYVVYLQLRDIKNKKGRVILLYLCAENIFKVK